MVVARERSLGWFRDVVGVVGGTERAGWRGGEVVVTPWAEECLYYLPLPLELSCRIRTSEDGEDQGQGVSRRVWTMV